MINKKRGQVTIFMVLAIIILLLGVLYFYYQRASLEEAGVIRPEVAPVKNFIETCVSNVVTQGIKILGLNGGYITFPEQIELNPRSYLQLGPVENAKNPYWWYDGIESIPPESFIVKQIEDHVASELDTCINDFVALNKQYNIKKLGEINVNVALNENDVTVNVNYPLELTNKLNRTSVKMEDFRQTVPIRLKKIYEIANDIMEAEQRDFFLEFKTIDLIALDEDIPTTDVSVGCQEKVWVMEDVKRKLQTLLRINLPYISIVGSDFNDDIFVSNPFGEDTYEDSYYNVHYKWQISEKNYQGLKVSFDYDNWPMQFHARPSKDGLLKSNAQKNTGLLDFLCLHIWHFTYDVTYPVRVTITDDTGLEPYQFSFAFKVSVDHNQPRRENLATTLFESPDIGNQEEYCNDVVNEITVYTLSNATNLVDVVDVNLTFTCGIFTCDIGQTDWLSFGAAAGLEKPFPYCVNGILRGKKEGFEDAQMFIQTEIPGIHILYLKPIKEFANYEVVKHDFDNPSTELKLEQDEKASITIKSTKESFETFGIYPSEGSFPIKLLNDNNQYHVTIYLSDGNDIIGGYQGKWDVGLDQLTGKNAIKFHVLEKRGGEDERFLFVSGLESYSDKVSQPELI